MCELNQQTSSMQNVQGTVIAMIKTLVRKAFPKFPIGSVDDILLVTLNGDSNPLKKVLDKFEASDSVFNLFMSLHNDDKDILQASINTLAEEVIPPHFKSLFIALYKLSRGDPSANLDVLSKLLGVKYEFLLRMLIACFKNDKDLIRASLSHSVSMIAGILKRGGVNINKPYINELKDYILALYNFVRSTGSHSINALDSDSVPGLDKNLGLTLFRASQGSFWNIELVLDKLGLGLYKEAIIEFGNLIRFEEANIKNLSIRLGVFEENYKIFESVVRLITDISIYYAKVKPSNDNLEELKKIMKDQYEEYREKLSKSVNYDLLVCLTGGAVDFDKFGKTGKVVKEAQGNDAIVDIQKKKHKPKEKELIEYAENYTKLLLDGDTSLFTELINGMIDYLELKADKVNYLKAMCTVITCFKTDMDFSSENMGDSLHHAFKHASNLLGIEEDIFKLMLDLFSGNPYRIFRCKAESINIGLSDNTLTAEFDSIRLNILSDILN